MPLRGKTGVCVETASAERKSASRWVRLALVTPILLIATAVLPGNESAAAGKKKPSSTIGALIAGGVDQLNGPMATAEMFNPGSGAFTCVGGTNSAGGCNDALS